MALQVEDGFVRKRLVSGLKVLLVWMLCQNLSFWGIDGAEHGKSAQQVRFAKSGLVRARVGGEQRAITDNSRDADVASSCACRRTWRPLCVDHSTHLRSLCPTSP